MARKPRALVIDASIAASAGRSDHPESRCCREFLIVMTEANRHVAMTPAVDEEWQRYMGNFARTWLTAMVSRGRVRWVKAPPDKTLRRHVSLASGDSALIQIMLDDIHLIEAALSADSLIASKDDEARTAFAQAARTVAALRSVCWVNPVIDDADCLEWLRNGARSTKRHRLTSQSRV
jgi:hypothetical protein